MIACLPHRRVRRIHAARAADGVTSAHGFTLVEVLVVVLVIAVLAAIAIPTFISQQQKGMDAQAQELARTAETTAETIGADNNGEYNNVTVEEVHRYEPTIPIAAGVRTAYLTTTTHSESEYSVTVKAANGDEFTITRSGTGAVTRECVSHVTRTGCSGSEHGSW